MSNVNFDEVRTMVDLSTPAEELPEPAPEPLPEADETAPVDANGNIDIGDVKIETEPKAKGKKGKGKGKAKTDGDGEPKKSKKAKAPKAAGSFAANNAVPAVDQVVWVIVPKKADPGSLKSSRAVVVEVEGDRVKVVVTKTKDEVVTELDKLFDHVPSRKDGGWV